MDKDNSGVSSTMQFCDLGLQYKSLQVKIDARIKRVLEHTAFINGPEALFIKKPSLLSFIAYLMAGFLLFIGRPLLFLFYSFRLSSLFLNITNGN